MNKRKWINKYLICKWITIMPARIWDLVLNNRNKKRTYHVIDFADPAKFSVKIKEKRKDG